MILFHGTTEIIEKPNVSFSKSYLDFGKGFYLTTYQKQAEKWALRKALRKQKSAIVNVYELSDDLEKYNVLQFRHQCHLDKIKKECKDKGTAFSKCHLEELKTIRSYKKGSYEKRVRDCSLWTCLLLMF